MIQRISLMASSHRAQGAKGPPQNKIAENRPREGPHTEIDLSVRVSAAEASRCTKNMNHFQLLRPRDDIDGHRR